MRPSAINQIVNKHINCPLSKKSFPQRHILLVASESQKYNHFFANTSRNSKGILDYLQFKLN